MFDNDKDEAEYAQLLERRLKGANCSLLRAVRASGLAFRFVALYGLTEHWNNPMYEELEEDSRGYDGDVPDAFGDACIAPDETFEAAVASLAPGKRDLWNVPPDTPLGRIIARHEECIARLRIQHGCDPPAYTFRRFLASASFYRLDHETIGDNSSNMPPADPAGGHAQWVSAPGKWGGRNDYITYGNYVRLLPPACASAAARTTPY